MGTRAERRGQNLGFYKSSTQERVAPFAPILFYDDFLQPIAATRAGVVTLDGTNPTPITTGLNAVESVVFTNHRTDTPADDPNEFTAGISGGTVNLYAWKHTSGTDATLVASTDSDDTIGWLAQGYRIGDTPWDSVQVNLNTAIGKSADGANGLVSLALDVDSNAEDALIYHGDERSFNLKTGLIFEVVVRVSVLPTLTAELVFGMAGNHNLSKDAITEAAWFKMDGSGAVVCETDDTTNNNDDKASGVTATAAQTKIYRIDFTDLSNVQFFIDGVHVASPGSGTNTTFDMSNLTDAEAVMQPYIGIDKTADAGLGTMLVDSVRIWGNRS